MVRTLDYVYIFFKLTWEKKKIFHDGFWEILVTIDIEIENDNFYFYSLI